MLRVLNDEEQDSCVPTHYEVEKYLAEPDDAVAASLTLEEKHKVAFGVLYGRKVAQAQLQHDMDEVKRVIAQKMLAEPILKEIYLDIYHALTKEEG